MRVALILAPQAIAPNTSSTKHPIIVSGHPECFIMNGTMNHSEAMNTTPTTAMNIIIDLTWPLVVVKGVASVRWGFVGVIILSRIILIVCWRIDQ